MIKKRTRPRPHVREREVSLEADEDVVPENDEEAELPYAPMLCSFGCFIMLNRLADLMELRKLRRAKGGIDVTKLQRGVVEKKRPREDEVGGLRKGARDDEDEYVHSSAAHEIRFWLNCVTLSVKQ